MKKDGFILILVIIVLAILTGVTLVFSNLTSDKTRTLSAEKEGYYYDLLKKDDDIKEYLYHKDNIVIKYGDEAASSSTGGFFSNGLRTYYISNPKDEDGYVFIDQGTTYKNNYNKYIPAREVINNGESWGITPVHCREFQDGSPDDYCDPDQIKWLKSSKFDLDGKFKFITEATAEDVPYLGYQEVTTFNSPREIKNINMGYQGKVYFKNPSGGEYKIKLLNISSQGEVYFDPGDYWIERLQSTDKAKLIVNAPTGTVRIYVYDPMEIKNGALGMGTANEYNVNGTADQLLIVGWDNITINQGSKARMAIYSEGVFTTRSETLFSGSIVGREIRYENNMGYIQYDTLANEVDMGAFLEGWVEKP